MSLRDDWLRATNGDVPPSERFMLKFLVDALFDIGDKIEMLTLTQISTTPLTAGTSVVTSVSASATSVSLLAANPLRLGATFFNLSSNKLFLKMGTTASQTDFTVMIPGGGFFELPEPVFTGAIDGIWNGTNSAVKITELTQ